MSDENGSGPTGWETVPIVNLCQINPKHDRGLDDAMEVSFVPMAAVSDTLGQITEPEIRRLGEVRKGYTHFGNGDVIFAKITPCMENGKAASVRGLVNGLACGTTEFFVLRSFGAVDQEYLFYFVRQVSYRKAARATMQSGVGQARVPKEFIETTELPIPPLAEQRRIVAKIEALQERSRTAREALAEVGPLLEQFRQSLLAAAFRGDLTADWRAENPAVEPARELLARIRTERRQKWEQAELAKMKSAGREPKNDKWKQKYSESAQTQELPAFELPTSWQWISFDEVTASVLYGPRFGTDEYDPKGIPTVRTTDMDFYGNIRLTGAPCVVIEDRQRNHFLLQPNDLLITRTGATIGKAALFDASIGDAIASAYLIRYRLTQENVLPKYLLYFLISPFGQMQLIGGTQAVAQPNINTKKIARIALPLPPKEEQLRIVALVNEAMQSIDGIAEFGLESEANLDQLDQSILAKAFRGELVPQDPQEEPAAVLLERIRQQREAAAQNGKPKRKTKRPSRKKKA